jgi:hypothetical protein
MTLHLPLFVGLCLLGAATAAHALEARVATVDGIPTLLVNGKPMPPLIFLHTAGNGAVPMPCKVTPRWQEFSFTFTAPVDDDNVAIHIRNITPVGTWFVDDARLVEGTIAQPKFENLLAGGDLEGEALPKSWVYFLNNSAGADAQFSLDRTNPHGGQSCLRVDVKHVGQAIYEIHTFYPGLRIQKGHQYTFAVWLRSTEDRVIEIQAIHQAPPWTVYGGETGASDRLLRLGAERGLHLGTPPTDLPWPKDGQPPDYTGLDAQMDHILAVDPDALILPRMHNDAPAWWKERHPDQKMLYDDGPHPMVSPASKIWRRDASEALRLYVRHLEEKYGDHILGYHVGCQSAGEWFYDWTWQPPMPCFEEPFRAAFAEWAAKKYGAVDALRAAWRQPDVTFETVRVPTLAERLDGKLGAFRDPASQRFLIDFAEYAQVCLVEYLEECARIVKDETKGRKLAVFFYGYLYDVAGFAYGGQVSGHLRMRRALDCPDVDIFCSPISYFDRGSGGVGPFMSAADSVQLHGKLWLNEDDARTHLAPPDADFGRTDDMRETLGVYRRNFGHLFERRCASWWMDFGTGWMADPTIFDNFARLRDIYRDAPKGRPYRPQVAVITDEDSFFYLRHSNEITVQSVSYMRRMFDTCGCPVGLYLMSDLCEGRVPDSVRLAVFLNCYRVTEAQREQIRRALARGGKTALWLYAPGFIKEDASADNVSDLLGFKVRQLESAVTAMVESTAGQVFGVDAKPKPLFAVAPGQAGVTVLGNYRGTGHIAMATKKVGGWTSVFCGGLQVSPEVLRQVARGAGAHVWCDTNDVISACPGFVSLHATEGGEKELVLPAAATLRDLITGEVLKPAAVRHHFAMQKGDTRLFAIDTR